MAAESPVVGAGDEGRLAALVASRVASMEPLLSPLGNDISCFFI